LTVGTPEVREIVTLNGLARGEVLRLAASVDRLSAHVLGEALVRAAQESALDLTMPSDVDEEPGQGIAGTVDGRRIAVGSRAFLRAQGYDPDAVAGASLATGRGSGEAHVLVGIDGEPAGVIVMADELRPDADSIVDRLRREGCATSRWCPATAPRSHSGSATRLASIASTPSSRPRTSSRSSARCATTRRSAP
jgi:cation transport ATPase